MKRDQKRAEFEKLGTFNFKALKETDYQTLDGAEKWANSLIKKIQEEKESAKQRRIAVLKLELRSLGVEIE